MWGTCSLWLIIALVLVAISPSSSFSRITRQSSLLPSIERYSSEMKVERIPRSPSSLYATPVDDSSSEMKTNIVRSISWAASATGFAALLAVLKGQAAAVEFSAGYLLELCLSVDNLFAFLILFDYFKVKPAAQEKILNYGILGAIILRGLFIAAGSVAISKFHDVLLVFAGVLAYSAFSILFGKEDTDDEVRKSMIIFLILIIDFNFIVSSLQDISNNKLVQFSKKLLQTSDQFDGDK